MLCKGLARDIGVLAVWIAFGIAASVFLNNFVLVNALVLSGSMEGTIMAENRVFGLRTSYLFDTPGRGDVIVFESPLPCEFPEPFIKRIIALPGEEIAITNGVVHIDGAVLNESYVLEAVTHDFEPLTIPANQFFVMGDNRNFSRDSREWGPICGDRIIGRIYLGFSPRPVLIANYVYAN